MTVPDGMYATRGGNVNSQLYSVDPDTGALSAIGATGRAITGLAVDPIAEILYGVTTVNSPLNARSLVTIDPLTGAATLVGSVNVGANPQNIPDIAFDSTGQLWGWSNETIVNGGKRLLKIDKATGACTAVGAPTIFVTGGGLDFDAGDVLYISPEGPNGKLYTVSTADGSLTAIDFITGYNGMVGFAVPAAAFTRNKAKLFFLEGGAGATNTALVDISGWPTAPFATLIGLTGIAGVDGLVAWFDTFGVTITATPTSGDAPLDVAFTATPNEGGATFAWDFGDGGTSTDQNPSHTFQYAGTYTVTLTATALDSSTATASVVITVAFAVARVYADLPWRGIVTDIDSRTLTLLDHRATDRSVLYTLNGPAYHSGQVASDDVEINRPFPDPEDPASVTNNRRLVFLFRREPRLTIFDPPYVCRFGGILMNVEDQGTDAPTTRYTAFDPWQLLMSRPIRNPLTGALPPLDGLKFNAKDSPRASDIALSFLAQSEAFEGESHIDSSDLSLLPDSSILTNGITFTEGLSVGEAWQQLCDTGTIDIHLDPLYDPNFAPTKVCRLRFVPQADGVAAGPVRYSSIMAWDLPGHSLVDVSRMVDGTRLANRIEFFAGEGGVAVGLQSDAASIAAYGEYWVQQFFPNTHDRVKVALLAVAELAIRRNGARSISFSPTPERTELPLRDYDLGDFVPVWASRNLREPVGIDYDAFDPDDPGGCGYERIYAIPIDIDDNGVARVRGILTSRDTATG